MRAPGCGSVSRRTLRGDAGYSGIRRDLRRRGGESTPRAEWAVWAPTTTQGPARLALGAPRRWPVHGIRAMGDSELSPSDLAYAGLPGGRPARGPGREAGVWTRGRRGLLRR